MKKRVVVISHARTINAFIMVVFATVLMIAEITVTKRIVKVVP